MPLGAWWNQTVVQPNVGPSVRIVKPFSGLSAQQKDSAVSVIDLARTALSNVNWQIQHGLGNLSPYQLEYLRYYFKLDAAADPYHATWHIGQRLSAIEQGLYGEDLKIKLTDVGYAYVNRYSNYSQAKKNRNGNDAAGYWGHTHIPKADLDPNTIWSGAAKLLHEEAHRNAFVDDHGQRGYVSTNGASFVQPGLTHEEAMNNADSYAQFVMAAYNLNYPEGYRMFSDSLAHEAYQAAAAGLHPRADWGSVPLQSGYGPANASSVRYWNQTASLPTGTVETRPREEQDRTMRQRFGIG